MHVPCLPIYFTLTRTFWNSRSRGLLSVTITSRFVFSAKLRERPLSLYAWKHKWEHRTQISLLSFAAASTQQPGLLDTVSVYWATALVDQNDFFNWESLRGIKKIQSRFHTGGCYWPVSYARFLHYFCAWFSFWASQQRLRLNANTSFTKMFSDHNYAKWLSPM